jgi:dTDP-glucose 4,6-dehydratase
MVTGGAGFIGSNFIHYILKKYPYYEVVNYDKLTYAGNLDNLKGLEKNPNYQFVHGDIDDIDKVVDVMRGCHLVLNFAAESHVDRSIQSSREFIKTNVLGLQSLLDAAKFLKIPRFIQISTDEVYGSRKKGFFKESDRLSPSSPYSASKAAADLLCYSYWVTYKMPIIITRSSNNFGPYQYPEKLIPLLITNALEDKPLPIYGDGKNVRDWLYVEDNCAAIDLVMHQGMDGQIYNIGGGNEFNNLTIAEMVLEQLKKPKSLIKFVADRPGHDFRYAIDTSKVKALGWQPRHDFNSALKKTIAWYQENKQWWQKLKAKEEEALVEEL